MRAYHRPTRRVRWGRLLQAAFLTYCLVYVFGYLYWQFFAFIWGPGPAWAIELVVWAGLPAAFLAGRFWRTCRGCDERDTTIRLLEDRAAELLRERDRALAGARLDDIGTYFQRR
jgi:hypothetical protein